LTLTVARERWLDTVKTLRDEPDYLFVHIVDVTAADYPSAKSASGRRAFAEPQA